MFLLKAYKCIAKKDEKVVSDLNQQKEKLSELINELKRLEKSTVSIVCLCGSMITALTNLSTAPIGTVAKAEWLFEA